MSKTKLCTRCMNTLPIENFKSRGKSNGAASYCMPCKYSARRRVVSATYQSYLSTLYSQLKSKKRDGDVKVTLELEHLIAMWEAQDGKCALSGVSMTHHRDGEGSKDFNASLDRIAGGGDYSPENVQLVCYRVNLMRHVLSVDMLYWWVKNIYNHYCD